MRDRAPASRWLAARILNRLSPAVPALKTVAGPSVAFWILGRPTSGMGFAGISSEVYRKVHNTFHVDQHC